MVPELNQLPTANTAKAFAAFRKAMDVNPSQRPHPDSLAPPNLDILSLGNHAEVERRPRNGRWNVLWEIAEVSNDTVPSQEVLRHHCVTR